MLDGWMDGDGGGACWILLRTIPESLLPAADAGHWWPSRKTRSTEVLTMSTHNMSSRLMICFLQGVIIIL